MRAQSGAGAVATFATPTDVPERVYVRRVAGVQGQHDAVRRVRLACAPSSSRVACAVGCALGLTLAAGASCGSKRQCTTLTCREGCCDVNDVCQPNSALACGSNAQACVECPAAQRCQLGVCTFSGAGGGTGAGGGGAGGGGTSGSCNASTCPGCCQAGLCLPGNTPQACGTMGSACAPCQSGICFNAQCAAVGSCTQGNCPGGCCAMNGTCVAAGTVNSQCGIGGSTCFDCSPGSCNRDGTCVASPPSCSASTCARGCCQGNTCVPAGQSNARCGFFGGGCSDCQGLSCGATGSCVPATCSVLSTAPLTMAGGLFQPGPTGNPELIGVKMEPGFNFNELQYELRYPGFPDPPPVTVSITDAGYRGCSACVLYAENCDLDGGSGCGAIFLGQSGSLTVNSANKQSTPGMGGGFSGASNVVLRQWDFSTDAPLPAGRCYLLNDSFSFSW